MTGRSDDDRAMDSDISEAEPALLVKAASVVQGLCGLFVALNGVQLVGVSFRIELLDFAPYVQIACGVAQIGLAAMQYRARPWAGYASAVFGVTVAVMMVAWLAHLLSSVLSCIMYLAVPLSALNMILAGVAIPPLLRAARARQRLADRGMDLGL